MSQLTVAFRVKCRSAWAVSWTLKAEDSLQSQKSLSCSQFQGAGRGREPPNLDYNPIPDAEKTPGRLGKVICYIMGPGVTCEISGP